MKEMHRGDDGVEFIVTNPEDSLSVSKFKELLKNQSITELVPADVVVDLVPVVRCKDCKHCKLLNDGVSFECSAWEMYFYAPTYDAATYYCADGKRRTANDQSD